EQIALLSTPLGDSACGASIVFCGPIPLCLTASVVQGAFFLLDHGAVSVAGAKAGRWRDPGTAVGGSDSGRVSGPSARSPQLRRPLGEPSFTRGPSGEEHCPVHVNELWSCVLLSRVSGGACVGGASDRCAIWGGEGGGGANDRKDSYPAVVNESFNSRPQAELRGGGAPVPPCHLHLASSARRTVFQHGVFLLSHGASYIPLHAPPDMNGNIYELLIRTAALPAHPAGLPHPRHRA
ncbi:unnamed protein product, partial [Pleuronectes platessa]